MSKMHKRVDCYVRVEVDTRYRSDPIPTRRECDDIAASVRRHVDDVSRAWTVEEFEHVCEFCGSKWTEDSKFYNGGCCDEDEAKKPVEKQP